ncbi:SWIM zinc finger domain protein [Nitzschia inconspicua]|uniref:SWIM zinc finger domain protein n=1 Tax=Nitzschia inconspicua TaxID=303405 RepID=A0A9K3M337_9STRA|nr:SWIM zinc finger domain protein [Nitzschia inconspicua]
MVPRAPESKCTKSHSQKNGKKIASMVTALSTTSSLPEKRALLTQLEQKSPDAYEYLMDIDTNRWMDSAWLEDEKLPPRVRGKRWCGGYYLGVGHETLGEMRQMQSVRIRKRRRNLFRVPEAWGGGLEEALLKVRPVDCVCDCGKWQAIGVPCVHGMAYFRHQMKWRLEDVLDQAVDEYHKYRTQRELYRRNFVPVWRHLLELDMMTLPPNVAARQMLGRPKTVRLRKNSRYAHEPEKLPKICSRCHQPGHNVRTCVRREAVKKRNAGNGAATISRGVL